MRRFARWVSLMVLVSAPILAWSANDDEGIAVLMKLSSHSAGRPDQMMYTFTLDESFSPPKTDTWYVTPYKSPATPYRPGEMEALVEYLNRFHIPFVSFENQTGLTDKTVAALADAADLQWLNLNGTAVTDAGLPALKACPLLHTLGAEAPGITPAGVNALATALGHPLTAIPRTAVAHAAETPRYVTIGPEPGTAIDGSYPRGRAWMDSQWTLYDLKGKRVSIADQKGKVLFINFWATWCGYCVKEMPSIASLAAALGNQNIFFACVTREDVGAVQRFLADHPNHPPIYRVKDLPSGGVFSDGIPATYIVAKPGDIAVKYIGSRQWDTTEVMKYLLRLASEKPPQVPGTSKLQ